MEKKICPLLEAARMISGTDYDRVVAECDEEKCGWWNEKFWACGMGTVVTKNQWRRMVPGRT